MKIGYLTHTLNPRTGAGAFSSALIDGVRAVQPNTEIVVLTSEDVIPGSKWGILKKLRSVRRVLENCDIVHALDGFPYGVVASLATVGFGKPLLITAIGTGALQKLSHPFYGPLLKSSYRSASIITAPSRFVARELSRAVPGLAVEVVPHGVSLGVSPDVSMSEFQKPYILSVGAIKRRKGYHISIPAFARLREKYKNLTYLIVGNPAQSPEYFSELKEIMQREGVGDYVKFVHGLDADQLKNVYAQAELFMLLPQNINGDVEGFGLVFLEAAAAGLPVVASLGTSAEDAVRNGKNGYLVEAEDIKAVAAAAQKILENPSLRATLSSESQRFAREMTWDVQIKKYLDLYAKL